MMKKILKFIGFLLLLIVGYVLIMFLISYIPVNKNSKYEDPDAITVYLNTNGVHTDFVVPYKSDLKNWEQLIPAVNANNQKVDCNYLSIGWGDKGFYLDIEEWADLDFKTAFNAAFGISDSAMHVTFLNTIIEDETCVKFKISPDNYLKLIEYIETRFKKDENGKFILIPNASYSNNDVFYDANGKYAFYYTCNTWVNQGLKASNQKAALWTLHDKGIFYHYK